MEFEWDEAKRLRTLVERGLDFDDLVRFEWKTALVRFQERGGELRKVAVGYLDGRLHVIGYVTRKGKLRVFSMRKANEKEQSLYASVTADG